jgi:NHL repeat-containing protein
MPAALHVSLHSSLKREPQERATPIPVLRPSGPIAILGGVSGADGLAIPVKPGATTLFGPRGASVIETNGPLWVSDTGHHRLLGWRHVPHEDGVPADWVIGQPDAASEGRNAKGCPGPATLNVPTGIASCDGGMVVADAWNHRVLVWHAAPRDRDVPADIVLGQPDFSSVESNRGADSPSASSLFWPYGVHWDGARLWVADTGNRRVLMLKGLPELDGQSADLVLGQRDFTTRDENGGGEPNGSSMRWPHGIALWNDCLCVADAGNNRIMAWQKIPMNNNASCDWILGQRDSRQVDHNQSLYWPDARSLNMPYGIASVGDWLIVADTANSRLIAWHADDCNTGAPARALSGQPDLHAKGDNRWRAPMRDSLCWPYAVAHRNGVAVISDSGNNRIVIAALAEGISE